MFSFRSAAWMVLSIPMEYAEPSPGCAITSASFRTLFTPQAVMIGLPCAPPTLSNVTTLEIIAPQATSLTIITLSETPISSATSVKILATIPCPQPGHQPLSTDVMVFGICSFMFDSLPYFLYCFNISSAIWIAISGSGTFANSL